MANPNVPAYDRDRAAKVKGGRSREAQDRSIQRSRLMSLQEAAEKGNVKGLMSLDPDPLRSFSSDVLKDPFGIDRKTWPPGKFSDKPRIITYFYKVDEVAGKLEHNLFPEGKKGGWVQVIEVIEASFLEEGRDTPIKPGRKRPQRRLPDHFRMEMPLTDEQVEFLAKHDFKALPTEPQKIFRKVPEAFKNLPVMPAKLRAVAKRVFIKQIDWNKIVSGKEIVEHFDKSRKTAFAVTLGMFEKFDLKVEKGTRMLFVMRDIYYESWENIHKKARQVFKPAAWFTMLAEGEFDAKGNFNWVNEPELIPPRLAKYAKAMGAISDDLKAVIKGFEKLFPSFIKKRP